MTMKDHKLKSSLLELFSSDKDTMKELMREALQTVLEGEMTEFLGAASGERRNSGKGIVPAITAGTL